MTAAARKRADLVLSGGGIKGVALVGAVGALIDARYGVQGCLAPRPARSSGR
jgi:predicted acylesterase/phospholipase RssA